MPLPIQTPHFLMLPITLRVVYRGFIMYLKAGHMKSLNYINPNETLSKNQAEEIERIYTMYPYLVDDDFVKKILKTGKKNCE